MVGRSDGKYWYFIKEGQTTGPHTTDEIQRLVLEGYLRLDDEVYLSENTQGFSLDTANAPIAAADAFKSLQDALPHTAPESINEPEEWLPPPRPNAPVLASPLIDKTASPRDLNIDYFSLLAQSSARASLPLKPASQSLAKNTTSPKKGRKNQSQARWDFQEITKSIRVAVSRRIKSNPSVSRFAIASLSLGLIGVGLWGIYKNQFKSQDRMPAASSALPGQTPTLLQELNRSATRGGGMPSATGTAIGRGQNPLKRESNIDPRQNQAGTAQAASDEQSTASVSAPEEPTRHFDPSSFEAVNTPVTPPNLDVNNQPPPNDPAAAQTENPNGTDRAPAAPILVPASDETPTPEMPMPPTSIESQPAPPSAPQQ